MTSASAAPTCDLLSFLDSFDSFHINCKSKHDAACESSSFGSSKRDLERVEDFFAQFADRNLSRQTNRRESVAAIIKIKTYGIQNEETLMERPVRCASGNAFKESRIGIEEVRVRKRDRKTVIAVSNVDESFGQAFSCGSDWRQKLVTESEFKARSRAVSEIAAIASFAYATVVDIRDARCAMFAFPAGNSRAAATEHTKIASEARSPASIHSNPPGQLCSTDRAATLLLHDRYT